VEKAEEELERGAFEPMYVRQDLQFGLGTTGAVCTSHRDSIPEVHVKRFLLQGAGRLRGTGDQGITCIARVMAPVPLGRKL